MKKVLYINGIQCPPKGRAMRQYLSDSICATIDNIYVTIDDTYMTVDNSYATILMWQLTIMTRQKLRDDNDHLTKDSTPQQLSQTTRVHWLTAWQFDQHRR